VTPFLYLSINANLIEWLQCWYVQWNGDSWGLWINGLTIQSSTQGLKILR
jgi:hypothetical protein